MALRNRPEQEADREIKILLTPHEHETLQNLIARDGESLSVAQLLQSFAADLTGSWRTNGSDERRIAFEWFKRRAEQSIECAEAQDWLESRRNSPSTHSVFSICPI